MAKKQMKKKKGQAPHHSIRAWRLHKKLSVPMLARMAGMSQANLSRVERGAQQYNEKIIGQLERALGVPRHLLVTRVPPNGDAVRVFSAIVALPVEKFFRLAAHLNRLN